MQRATDADSDRESRDNIASDDTHIKLYREAPIHIRHHVGKKKHNRRVQKDLHASSTSIKKLKKLALLGGRGVMRSAERL